MANLNRIILVGRLTADPEVRATADGLPIAKLRLAVNRPAAGGETATDFIDVVAWRRLAEICGEYLKKGRLILVEGRIQNRSFEDQLGQRRWVTEVIAKNMTMLEKSQIFDRQSSPIEVEAPAAGTTDVDGDPVVDEDELAGDLPF